MGKKRRYRKFPHKFGRKYALKYGTTINQPGEEEVIIEVASSPAPVVLAPPTPTIDPDPAIETPETKLGSTSVASTIVEAIESTAPPKKKKATRKKTTTTTRKTTRKRTTRSKTTS
jgi:hypothetical protein